MAANLNQALDRSRFFSWTPGPSIFLDLQLGLSYFIKLVMLQLCCCSVSNLCPTLCDPMGCSTPDFSVHYLPEFTQIHVHGVSDAIQPSHLLPSLSPFAFN